MHKDRKESYTRFLEEFMLDHPYGSLLVLTLLMLILNLPTMPVSIMEARIFVTVREMIHDGNWLLTTLNGLPRYEKPPLPTWICSIFSLLTGSESVTILRLPAMLMVFITSLYLYRLCLDILSDRKLSLLAGAILISSFYTFGIVFEAPVDIYAFGFVLAGIYYLHKVLNSKEKTWLNAILSGFFIGCSILSKGPVPLYILFLPYLVANGIVFRFRQLRSKAAPLLLAVLVASVSGLWWFLYVRFSDPVVFLAIASKESHNWSDYHVKPFYYYWSFFIQSGMWVVPAFLSLLYPYLKKRTTSLSAYRFSICWTLAILVFLSIVPEKKDRYLMPILIPLAIQTAIYLKHLAGMLKREDVKVWERQPFYLNFGLIGILALCLPAGLILLPQIHLASCWPAVTVILTCSLTAALFIFSGLKRKAFTQVLLVSMAFNSLLFGMILPVFSDQTKLTDLKKMEAIHQFVRRQKLNLYCSPSISPEVIWNYGDKIKPIPSESRGLAFPTEKECGFIAESSYLDSLRLKAPSWRIHDRISMDLNPRLFFGKRSSGRLEITYFHLTRL